MCSSLKATHHAAHIPDIHAVRPRNIENNLWSPVGIGLNVLAMLQPIVQWHSRSEITQHRSTKGLRHAHCAREVNDTAVEFLLGARLVQFFFLKLCHYELICWEQDVGFLDVRVGYVALLVKEIQSDEQPLEHEGYDWWWQSSYGIAVLDVEGALPEWGVDQASVPPATWRFKFERVNHRAHGLTAGVVLGRVFDASVNIELGVHFLS